MTIHDEKTGKPKIAVIGSGYWGKNLIRNLDRLGVLAMICGVTIGRYAFIGARAVVSRDVPDHSLAFGNPARPIGWMCRCGERLDEELSCGACGLCYQREGAGLRLFEASSK